MLIDFFKKYLEEKAYTPTTIKNYLSDLRHFLSQLGKKPITLNALGEYRTYLKFQKISPKTIARRTATLRKFEDFLRETGFELSSQPPSFSPLRYWRLGGAIIVILISIFTTFFLSQRLKRPFPATKTPPSLVPVTAAVYSPWIINFRGKLTTADGKPITQEAQVVFRIYKSPEDNQSLWTSKPWKLEPDPEGIFSAPLGDVTRGDSEIPSRLFFQNERLYLGIGVNFQPELTPRSPISTASHVTDAYLLQEYPPAFEAKEETIPLINKNGSLILASETPKIRALNDTFAIEGQAITIQTPTASDGNITLSPDGSGQVNLRASLDIQNANLIQGSLIKGYVGNDATGYNLLELTSGSTPTTKFSVDAGGDVDLTSGNLKVGGVTRLNSLGRLTSITGYSQDSGNFEIDQGAPDYAKITKSGVSAKADSLTLTLDETDYTDSTYDALVLSRQGGKQGAYALYVSEGDVLFSGQLEVKKGLNVVEDLSVKGKISSNLIPSVDNTYDLGSSSNEWRNLYLDGIAYINAVSMESNITMPDDSWIGLGASAGRIEFDDQTTDEVNILSANVGIGTTAPSNELEVSGDIELTNLYDNDASNFFDGGCSATQTVSGIDSTGAISCTTITGVSPVGSSLTSAYLWVGNASNLAAAVNPGGDVEISNTGVTTIQANAVALATDTTGNYVASITGGSGIDSTGATSGENISHTLSLGNLTADWSQGGAYDIKLTSASSELKIMESAGGLYYGIFDVGDLGADQTFTFTTGGTVVSSGNVGSYAVTSVGAGTGLTGGGGPGVITINAAGGTDISVAADAINNTSTLATLTGRGASTTTQLAFNYNTGSPFTVLNSTVVTNLNADLLDGYSWGNVPDGTDIWVNETGDTMTGQLNMHAGSYEGSITFGSNSTWRTGIRQHDDGDAELRIWAKNAAGMIFLATGYDGEPTSIARPTDGLVVQNNNVGIGNFSSSDPAYDLHVKGTGGFTGNLTVSGTVSAGTAGSYFNAGGGYNIYFGAVNWSGTDYPGIYSNGSWVMTNDHFYVTDGKTLYVADADESDYTYINTDDTWSYIRNSGGSGVYVDDHLQTSSTVTVGGNLTAGGYLDVAGDIYLGSQNTQIESDTAVGRLTLHGSGDNSMDIGPYNDGGWGYITSTNNANGLYFNTNQGSFQFDTGNIIPYTNGEISLGTSGNRFSNLYASGTATVGNLECSSCIDVIDLKWSSFSAGKTCISGDYFGQFTLTGALFVFYPQTACSAVNQCSNEISFLQPNTSLTTTIGLGCAAGYQSYVLAAYLQYSPPYYFDGYFIPHFVYVLREKDTNRTIGVAQAPDPPWQNTDGGADEIPHPFADYYEMEKLPENIEIAFVDSTNVDEWKVATKEKGISLIEYLIHYLEVDPTDYPRPISPETGQPIWVPRQTTWRKLRLKPNADQIQLEPAVPMEPKVEGADLAEYFASSPLLSPGEIVDIDKGSENTVLMKTKTPYSPKMVGIISTNPAQVINVGGSDGQLPLALAGQVPVKVSNINGPIEVGDPITSSSIPGVGMRAIKAGPIVGKALEEWTSSDPNEIGKITVFLNVSWYDPDVFLTSAGGLQIINPDEPYNGLLADETDDIKDQIAKIKNAYQNAKIIKEQTGEVIDRVITAADGVFARVKTGLIETKYLIAENVVVEKELISPVVETDELRVKGQAIHFGDLIIQDAKFEIQDASGSTTVAIDSQGNASFSGEIVAKSARFRELVAEKIKAESIEGLEAKFATLAAQTIVNNYYYEEATEENSIAEEEEATESALLAQLEEEIEELQAISYEPLATSNLNLDSGIFNEYLAVLGQASIVNLEVTNSFVVNDTMQINSNSIGVVGGDNTLYIQPSGIGMINMLAGKFVIDEKGNVEIAGDVHIAGNLEVDKEATVSGSLFADLIKASNIEASGSARFAQVETKKLIIASDNTPRESISATPGVDNEVITNATAGTAILPTGYTELTIYNDEITDESLIYITPISDTQNKVLYVKAKKAGGWFKVAIDETVDLDIEFNWWIIN